VPAIKVDLYVATLNPAFDRYSQLPQTGCRNTHNRAGLAAMKYAIVVATPPPIANGHRPTLPAPRRAEIDLMPSIVSSSSASNVVRKVTGRYIQGSVQFIARTVAPETGLRARIDRACAA